MKEMSSFGMWLTPHRVGAAADKFYLVSYLNEQRYNVPESHAGSRCSCPGAVASVSGISYFLREGSTPRWESRERHWLPPTVRPR